MVSPSHKDAPPAAAPVLYDSDRPLVRDLGDLAATQVLARDLSAHVQRGDVIALFGDLGCGKTAFARAFIQELAKQHGFPPVAEVPSPTFTLVQVYDFCSDPQDFFSVWHFDLFRIKTPQEAYEIGIEDAFAHGLCLIEWPDRLGALLPPDRLDLEMAFTDQGDARRAILTGQGKWAERLGQIFGQTSSHGASS